MLSITSPQVLYLLSNVSYLTLIPRNQFFIHIFSLYLLSFFLLPTHILSSTYLHTSFPHLRVILNPQYELYLSKEREAAGIVENGPVNRDRKQSTSSGASSGSITGSGSGGGGGIKNRWLKAFKSLKSVPTPLLSSG